jgi:hypothetical protein
LDSWSPAAPGELSTQSEEFRTRSAAQNVWLHQTGANAAMVEEIARASGCGLISNDSGDLDL